MNYNIKNVNNYDYILPDELIAQTPAEPRDSSRLMTAERGSGNIEHRRFSDIINYLHKGDLLVINRTKVIPARLMGKKKTGALIEIFLLKRYDINTWECMVKPGKRMKTGDRAYFGDELNPALSAEVIDIIDEGNRVIKFYYEGIFEEVLEKLGEMPLPPYITEHLKDGERYQTVYAHKGESVAAPTAGLHFTRELLGEIEKKGIKIAEVYLDVGLGTFRPVKTDNIDDHKMHSEKFEIPEETAVLINETKAAGGRIIAVGTTSVRTLESGKYENGKIMKCSGHTEIFIYPGYEFKAVDGIITNFHLPKSTLLMLISAFAGRENVMKWYETAVSEKYRFFSFGDAMFIK